MQLALGPKDRDEIAAELKTMMAIAQEGIGIIKSWLEANSDLAAGFATFPSGYMGLVTPEGGLELYDGDIRLKDSRELLASSSRVITSRM